MLLFCVRCGPNKCNMGDLIGPYLAKKINPNKQCTLITTTTPHSKDVIFMTCGSILQPSLIGSNSVVWGSGIIARDVHFIRKPKNVTAVRGPLSRQALLKSGIKCPEVYGDPGLLLPIFYPNKNAAKQYKVGIIPHYVDYEFFKKLFANVPEVHVIQMDYPATSVDATVEGVCSDIMKCEYTIASSLHGVVISHAYGIPCAWMNTKNKLWGDGVKFYDYFASIGIENKVTPINWNLVTDYKNVTILKDMITKYAAAKPKKIPNLQQLLDACPF